MTASLILEDGTVWNGFSFGSTVSRPGEVGRFLFCLLSSLMHVMTAAVVLFSGHVVCLLLQFFRLELSVMQNL